MLNKARRSNFVDAMLKLIDTKNLKAGDRSQIQSIVVQYSLKHPIKTHNFNLAFN